MKPTRVIVRVDFDNGESMTIDGKPADGWHIDDNWPVRRAVDRPDFEHVPGARTVDVTLSLAVADDGVTLRALQ